MDGEINFKAYFDYGDAMRGVDDLTNKFEAAGMKLSDAFDFGRSFEGSKQELKKFIGDLEVTLGSVKQQIKDATAGMTSDKTLQNSLEEQLKAAEATSRQASEVYVAAMAKRLQAQKKAYGGIEQLLDSEEKKLERLKAQYDEMTEAFKTQDPSTIEQDSLDYYNELANAITEASAEVEKLSGQLDQAREEFGKESDNSFLSRSLADANAASEEVSRLKKEIEELKSGVGGSGATEKDLENLKKKAEQLDATVKGAKARLKDPDMATGNIFNGLTQGFQGLMGAYTAASGVLAQFGADEKDLQKVQTQLQGSMSILMGIQQVYNALQTESAFRTQVLDKVMLKLTDTYKKVAASSMLTKLGAAGLIAATIAGIAALMVHLSKFQKKQEDLNKVAKGTASGVAEQIVAYRSLQKQWKDANGDLEKQNKILKDSKWDKLNIDIKGVNGAQKVLVDNSQQVIDALMAEAEAQALYGLAVEKAEKAAKNHYDAEVLRKKNKEGNYNFWERLAGSIAAGPNATAESINAMTGNLVEARAQRKDKKEEKAKSEMESFLELMEQAKEKARAGGLNIDDDEALKNAGKHVSDLLKEQARERERLQKDLEFDIRQKRIVAMKESSAKELAQMSLDHDKEMESLKRQKEDRLKQLQDEQMARQKAGNPNLKDYQVGSNIRELPKEEAEMYAEQEKLLNEAYARSTADLLLKYDSIAVQRADLEKKWAETIETTTDERIKQILEKERNLELAQFDEQAVEQFGTKSQKYKAMKARMDAEVDALVDDTQKKIAQAANDVELTEFLFGDPAAYNNLAQAKEAVTAIYDARIKQAQAEEDVVKEQQLQRELAQELLELQKQYSATFALIYADAQKLTTNQLQKAKVATQEAIKEAAGSGDIQALTDLYSRLREQMNVMGDRERGWGFSGMVSGANRLQDADFKRMQAEALSAIDADMFAEEIKRLMEDAINDDEQGWAAINKGAQEVKETLGGIGEILQSFGDDTEWWAKSLYEAGGFLTGLSSGLDNIETAFSKNASAGDKISVAVSGTIQIFGMVLDSIRANKEAQEEWNRTIDESGHRLDMLRLEALDYKQQNIFGVENPYKKAIDGAVQYSASMEELAKMTAKLNEGQVQTGTKKVVDWSKVGKGAATGVAAGASIGSIIPGIGTAIGAAIGGAIGLIAGAVSRKTVPVFESLQKQYGQLFNPDTYELNEKLIADYDKLDDATKQIVDNWDEIVAKAKEAEEQMRENFSNLAGDIGTQLSDSLVDAFKNGELDGAVDDFHKKMNATIEDIIQQMVFSNVFSGMFDELQKDMEASFRGPNADNNIVDDLIRFEEAYQQGLADYEEQMNDARKYLQSKGYDAWENEDERKAQTRTALGASQDSVDESNARLTTIQGHTYEINENVRKLVAAAGLSAAAGAILPSFPAMEPVAARDYSEDLLRITEELVVLSKNDDRFMAAIAELQSVAEGIRASSQRTSENTDEANAVAARIRSNLETVVDRGVTMR